MKTQSTKKVGETFQKIADIVTPTMGARGRLAVIANDMGRPYLTDDGVTVAREALHFDDKFEQMIALSMVEASSNTERKAYDGTTLTVLLTNEFYKAGEGLIKKGVHPQIASKMIEDEAKLGLGAVSAERLKVESNPELVKHVANITTKIPEIGEMVFQAYKMAGKEMNVIIEHDRKIEQSEVEHVDGMVIDAGYFTENLRQLCNSGDKYEAENARCIVFSENQLTPLEMKAFLGSITDPNEPLIFFISKSFNPENMQVLLDALAGNKLPFMFVFVNEANPEEIFMDVAAKTGGKTQSQVIGTDGYTVQDAGIATKIIVEKDKTTIMADGTDESVDVRIKVYEKELLDNRYTMGPIRQDAINRRLSNLRSGITKIKLACATVTEFMTIRMKLDDAIGAVRCACKDGVVLGGGKACYVASTRLNVLKSAFMKPAETIAANAGLKVNKKVMLSPDHGLDVVRGLDVNLLDAGIVDSFTSIEQAIINASSIACSYLKAYILINSKVK